MALSLLIDSISNINIIMISNKEIAYWFCYIFPFTYVSLAWPHIFIKAWQEAVILISVQLYSFAFNQATEVKKKKNDVIVFHYKSHSFLLHCSLSPKLPQWILILLRSESSI